MVIDIEYPERMGDIKEALLKLIRHRRRDFAREQIVFYLVGKQSAAHKRAIGVYRGQSSPDLILTVQQILDLTGK